MSMLNSLRQAKRQAFLVSKKIRCAGAAAAPRDADRSRARFGKWRPSTCAEGKFTHTFLRRPGPEDVQQEKVLGYRETDSANVPELPHFLGGCLRTHYRAVLGASAFICRPRSLFTAEWVRELHAWLDFLQEPLREANASGCDPYDAPADYPIRWTEILGDITQPLSLKHLSHLRFSDRLRPQLEDYR